MCWPKASTSNKPGTSSTWICRGTRCGWCNDAFSGEEYRQELRAGLADPDLAAATRRLPWGSGSGLVRHGSLPGYVFCARVGDHPDPVFRYVDMTDPGSPVCVSDTLAALSHAHATAETPRVLDDDTHRRAYDAWAAARADILERWTHATDPTHLQPAIPKTMRDAADLIRRHPPAGMEQTEVDDLIDRLEAPYANRIQKLIRDAMRDADTDPSAAADAVAHVTKEQGLQPAEPPKPLPVITETDIPLVCWQAIVSGDR